jgi:DnaJ-class molecular chaperone
MEEEMIEIDNIIPFPYKVKVECPDCRGKGLVTAFAGRVSGEHKCPRCNGSGKLELK